MVELVDGGHDRARRFVRRLPGVDGERLEGQLVVRLAHRQPRSRKASRSGAREDPDRTAPVEHEHRGEGVQAVGHAVDALALTHRGHGRLHDRADRQVEDLRMVQGLLEEEAVRHRTDHLGEREGRLRLDDGNLGDAVLFQDRGRRPDRLRGMDVHERGQPAALRGQDGGSGLTGGPGEAVVGHPCVGVQLGEVASPGVGDEDHDHVVGDERLARPRAPRTRRYRSSHPRGSPPASSTGAP